VTSGQHALNPRALEPGDPGGGARYRVTALLGLIVESTLTGSPVQGWAPGLVRSPWDLWWACYRAACPPPPSLRRAVSASSCAPCAAQVDVLLDGPVPAHPQQLPQDPCQCMRTWAVAMRRPAPEMVWPAHRVSLALTKPGAAASRVLDLLCGQGCDAVDNRMVRLSADDVRRLYPEAYGAQFVRAQDEYLTSAPCRVLVLLLPERWTGDPVTLKRTVRAAVGPTDVLRNHVHMPDNPADALADMLHLAGASMTEALYDQHERPSTADRIEGYRRVVARAEAISRAG
jgi:nucleoside diphosphate kinase